MNKSSLAVALALSVSTLAAAADYPTRPVRVILAVPAGGTPDVMARTVTPAMSRVLGQQLVVDNRAGAGGLIGAVFNSIPPVLAHIKGERVRALGVGGSRRSAQLPDVPTITEAGVLGYESITWFGFLAPAKTPKPILAQLSNALATALATPETRALIETQGMDAGSGRAEDFAALIRREYERNAKVVKAAGVKVD